MTGSKKETDMQFTKLGAETARGAKDILNSAYLEIAAEMTRRFPGDWKAQEKGLDRPLRMVIFFALDDLDLQRPVSREDLTANYQKLTAETARGAKDILNSCLEQIRAQMLRRFPGDFQAQTAGLDQPLRTTVQYDIKDLDREGPLNVDEVLAAPYDGIPLSLKRPGKAGLYAPAVTDKFVLDARADGSPLLHGQVGKGKSRFLPYVEELLRSARLKGSFPFSGTEPDKP
ncbi:hypothetical protein [Streptomyces yangpuensis]|uniref:hypothetical protein n=1 Tax=Streptomyces yangpuensis TaxID=1648182 RepID=UPI003653CA3D